MSGWLKKVKALDPHLRYPEVGLGEAGCRNHFNHDTAIPQNPKNPLSNSLEWLIIVGVL